MHSISSAMIMVSTGAFAFATCKSHIKLALPALSNEDVRQGHQQQLCHVQLLIDQPNRPASCQAAIMAGLNNLQCLLHLAHLPPVELSICNSTVIDRNAINVRVAWPKQHSQMEQGEAACHHDMQILLLICSAAEPY